MGGLHYAMAEHQALEVLYVITLNHTIVPAHDKEESARFFADILGLTYEDLPGHFAPVRVNDALTLDFDNRDRFESSLRLSCE